MPYVQYYTYLFPCGTTFISESRGFLLCCQLRFSPLRWLLRYKIDYSAFRNPNKHPLSRCRSPIGPLQCLHMRQLSNLSSLALSLLLAPLRMRRLWIILYIPLTLLSTAGRLIQGNFGGMGVKFPDYFVFYYSVLRRLEETADRHCSLQLRCTEFHLPQLLSDVTWQVSIVIP